MGLTPPVALLSHGLNTPCHPTKCSQPNNFYMVSQYGLKGTARPSHYHILANDPKATRDEIERLTFDMCFLYARATKVVSRPAPVYYAHRAAFLAQYYETNCAPPARLSQRAARGVPCRLFFREAAQVTRLGCSRRPRGLREHRDGLDHVDRLVGIAPVRPPDYPPREEHGEARLLRVMIAA